ncbi:MAG: YdcF family protein [Burkholderiales bacterium]
MPRAEKRNGGRRIAGYAALLMLMLSGVGIVTLVRIRRATRAQPLVEGDAIVVFGAAVWEGGPSATLRRRTLRSAELYKQGLAPVIVCSGGFSGGVSEPRAMAEILIAEGVPPSAIVLDEAGVTTRETILSILQLGRGQWRRVLAVSSPFHLLRIVEESRRRGIEALPCPAWRPPAGGPAAKLRLLIWDARQYGREIVAVWAYRIAERAGARPRRR